MGGAAHKSSPVIHKGVVNNYSWEGVCVEIYLENLGGNKFIEGSQGGGGGLKTCLGYSTLKYQYYGMTMQWGQGCKKFPYVRESAVKLFKFEEGLRTFLPSRNISTPPP